MCRLCDNPNPDGDAEDDLDGLRSAIRDHLWLVKCVPDERRPHTHTHSDCTSSVYLKCWRPASRQIGHLL